MVIARPVAYEKTLVVMTVDEGSHRTNHLDGISSGSIVETRLVQQKHDRRKYGLFKLAIEMERKELALVDGTANE